MPSIAPDISPHTFSKLLTHSTIVDRIMHAGSLKLSLIFATWIVQKASAMKQSLFRYLYIHNGGYSTRVSLRPVRRMSISSHIDDEYRPCATESEGGDGVLRVADLLAG